MKRQDTKIRAICTPFDQAAAFARDGRLAASAGSARASRRAGSITVWRVMAPCLDLCGALAGGQVDDIHFARPWRVATCSTSLPASVDGRDDARAGRQRDDGGRVGRRAWRRRLAAQPMRAWCLAHEAPIIARKSQRQQRAMIMNDDGGQVGALVRRRSGPLLHGGMSDTETLLGDQRHGACRRRSCRLAAGPLPGRRPARSQPLAASAIDGHGRGHAGRGGR